MMLIEFGFGQSLDTADHVCASLNRSANALPPTGVPEALESAVVRTRELLARRVASGWRDENVWGAQ